MSIVELESVSFTEETLVLNPTHLLNITDDTGLFQHCRYSVPDRMHGYTLDDNVRALIVAAGSEHPALLARLDTYLSFVMYCQRPDGLFRNFMGYDRRFLEEVGSADSQGRTVWALGVLYQQCPAYRPLVEPMLKAALPHLSAITHLRAKAFAILGLHFYLQANPFDQAVQAQLERLADDLQACWQTNPKETSWQWFEDALTYENARLPQAMFAAFLTTGRKVYLETARQATAFLEKIQFERGYLKLVGNQGWLQRGQKLAEYDEQPVDAGALVEMFAMAYQATRDNSYRELAHQAFGWYLGRNCNNLALYEPISGGCYDALTKKGVNLNQGAESVLSYQMALHSLNTF